MFSTSNLPRSLLRPSGLMDSWFLLLWTSVQHWRQCVYLPDSSPLRTLPLELPTPSGGNRTVQAQVLREAPLVMSIQGLATAAECDELAESQDLLDMGDLEMAYVSGAVHSKTRRTLTKNVYVAEDLHVFPTARV
eukprot:s4846_g3.t1